MENKNEKILTLEEEEALRKPFEEHVGEIQKEIDNLRENGTFMVMKLSEEIDAIKRDKIYSKRLKLQPIHLKIAFRNLKMSLKKPSQLNFRIRKQLRIT